MADEGDICEAHGGDLLRGVRYQMPQLLLHFIKTFHAPKTFRFLAASLLKVKKLLPIPGKLVVHLEADSSDLCVAESG